jgi:hypothetical protein
MLNLSKAGGALKRKNIPKSLIPGPIPAAAGFMQLSFLLT